MHAQAPGVAVYIKANLKQDAINLYEYATRTGR